MFVLVAIVVIVASLTSGELTQEDYAKAKPGHLEYDPDFQKRFPNIPGPSTNFDSRIVGGVEVVRNSRPYQAGLYIPVPGGFTSFCGGSLINSRTILTAAHCVDNRVANITVHLGAHNMPPTVNDTYVVTRSSGDVVIYPLWDRSRILHDVALIRFDDPVPLSVNITPILLPVDGSHDYLSNQTLVSGWGRPADNVVGISPVLREVSTFIISNYACRLAYLGTVEPSNICTSGAHGRGTCQGDSGGPLVLNGAQIGVVSFGSSFGCAQGWPAAYARVTYYLNWIRANQAQA